MSNPLTKELVRAWLQRRLAHPEPPPDMEQIRREVGWAGQGKEQDAPASAQEDSHVLAA